VLPSVFPTRRIPRNRTGHNETQNQNSAGKKRL
jgi:hypothetical protein